MLTTSIRRISGLRATMPDGAVLVADAWIPDGGGRWPVLLQRLPYGRSVASTPVLPHPVWLARQGYAVVVQDVRGRGESSGRFVPFIQEAADGAATVEWVAQMDFSNGDVATYGFSYQGLAQLYMAAEQPPSLRAIAPMMCCPDPYEGWTYEGGCLRWPFVAFWSAQLAGQESGGRPVPYDINALPISQALGDGPPAWFQEWLQHPQDDAYWDARRPLLEEIVVPAFTVLGYFDDFSAGTAQLMARLEPEGVCGPWAHMPWGSRAGDVELGPEAGPARVAAGMVSFFDRVLKGGRQRSSQAVTYYTGGRGWRASAAWPPDHSIRTYTCASSGNANSRHGDGRLLDGDADSGPSDVLVAQGLDPYPGTATPLENQGAAEDRRDVLCYTTRELTRNLTILGSPLVTVTAQSDVSSHDLVASVVWVSPDGATRRLTTGARRAEARAGGGSRRFDIQLRPICWTIPSGHHLRLDISASRFPEFDRNPHNGAVAFGEARPTDFRVASVEIDEARLELPVEEGP
ncbi:MAG: CocE/NonD family hydrolase [Acidimicrobiia bacterium]